MDLLRRCFAVLLILAAQSARIEAQASGRFDLTGPKIDVRVTRAGVTLPIASVPNLQPGDELWLHPDLPPTQSVHYLLIATFLRGTTNPPPDNWFIRIETWDKKVREEGVSVTVPAEAQQAILFLAPETGGDFGTLRSAVKGRPGIFVRASQDLAEAGFEQARIEKYLAAMKQVPPGDAKALQEHSDLLARTLNLKPNPDCFKRPLDQQYTCLTQVGTQTLLDDGHSQSVASALSNGPSSDFINQASYTKLAGAGNYSAYVGAIVDLVRLTSGLHTAKYQYIPAISFPDERASPESLNLRLNTAPSFNNPKSVIVIGLPGVLPSIPPPLRPVDPSYISCLVEPNLALAVEGAPLVFSTNYAHNLVLHLNVAPRLGAPSRSALSNEVGSHTPLQQDIPLIADAYRGGLAFSPAVFERKELPPVPAPNLVPIPSLGTRPETAKLPAPQPAPVVPGETITGTIQGFWGFDQFTGPTLPLQQLPGEGWHIVTSANQPATNLIAGQPNHVQLLSTGTACIQSIALEPGNSQAGGKIDWKLAKPPETSAVTATPEQSAATPDKPGAPGPALATIPPTSPVDVTLNLQRAATPGSIHLAIQQFGQKDPDQLGTETFAEPAKIDALLLHTGDTTAVLTGTSLDQVKSLTLRDLTFEPQPGTGPLKDLNLALPKDAKSPSLKPNEKVSAEVHLRDGRTLPVSGIVLPPRPSLSILSRKVTKVPASPILLTSNDDLALGSQLVFFLKSKASFPRSEQVEIATEPQPDQAEAPLHTTLTVDSGALVLQDAHTILATFDPLKTFGPSTFGPFRMRAVAADGTAGEWQPLATIVRLPTLTALTCPVDPAANCTLTGSGLYLIASISADPAFTAPTTVPEGFVDTSLAIPHPATNAQPATFYLRLRDDPATAQQVNLNVITDSPTPPASARSRGQRNVAPAPAPPLIPEAPAPSATPPPAG